MRKACQGAAALFLFLTLVWGQQAAVTGDEFDASVYARRREALMPKLEGGIAILTQRVWDGDDFYYLTGFDEPEAVCLLIPDSEDRYVLFVRPDDPARTLWTGKRHGVTAATEVFGADAAFPLDQFENVLPRYLRGRDRIFCSPRDRELLDLLQRWVGNPTSAYPQAIIDPTRHIHAMRLIKDAEEIRLLREAVSITCDALKEVMKTAESGKYEYELEAVLEYVFHLKGAPRPGFPSIVGSGPNSTILHYESNRRRTEDGDLVLMDVGAEVGRYSADVTRTFPVNGQFSPEQREVYEIVLEANRRAVSVIAPGVGLYQVHLEALQAVRKGLLRLGLITDAESDWQTGVWLMYNTNHWIGLDVHDVGGRGPGDGVGMRLRPGMVLTVEPGIYVGEHSLRIVEARMQRATPARRKEMEEFMTAVGPAVARYMNIGIRIEDDVLVTAEGYEVLSGEAPKEIRDIEAVMKQTGRFVR